MNQRTKEAVYAAIEKKVEAHLARLDRALTPEQLKQLVAEAMNLLRQPIYH
jgi:hypothetical protein